jgi:hypothetical protein
MASPLNVFKTVTDELTDTNSILYTAPAGFTGIVLMAQVSNTTTTSSSVTFSHNDTSATTETELVKELAIPGNDSTSVVTGKLVIEEGDSVKAFASENNALKIVLSILESRNA